MADVKCPRCGAINILADAEGATDGPRAFHAICWRAMSDGEQADAWKRAEDAEGFDGTYATVPGAAGNHSRGSGA